jgi:hypothetical protein
MPKDINIHLKTTGAEQTKEQLNQVASGTQKVGAEATRSGREAEKGMGLFGNVLGKLAGPLGIAAIAAKLSDLASGVAAFFDNIKAKADDAVANMRGLRREFDDLYEAMNVFDEKGQRIVTEAALTQLQKTGTPKEIGLPIIKAYTQKFKDLVDAGQLTQEQYERGLEEMLSYGAIHGKAATPDLIAMMSGWGMTTPEQQGAFRRQIGAGAEAVGLDEEDIIAALTKGGLTVKAMGWTPGYAVEMIATIAANEAGRTLKTLPATTLQGIMTPQVAKAPEYGLDEQLFEQPVELLTKLAELRAAGPIKRLRDRKEGEKKYEEIEAFAGTGIMKVVPAGKAPPEYEEVEFQTMLTDIYGAEAGLGVRKILMEQNQNRAAIIQRAATEEGAAAEATEREADRTTQRFREAATAARAERISHRTKSDQEYMADVRRIGANRLKQLRTEEPISQWLRTQYFGTNEEAKKEYGAYREFEEQLTEHEKQKMVAEYEGPGRYFILTAAKRRAALVQRWKEMTAQEKYEALTVIPEPGKQQLTSPGRSASAAGMVPEFDLEIPTGRRGELSGATESPPVINNFDSRVSHIMILNPVTGMNKQDLGIDPPWLA